MAKARWPGSPCSLNQAIMCLGFFCVNYTYALSTFGSPPKIYRSCVPIWTAWPLGFFPFFSFLPEVFLCIGATQTSFLLSHVCVLLSSALNLTPCLSHLEQRCNYTTCVTQGFQWLGSNLLASKFAGCRSQLGDWAGKWDLVPSWTSD